jgi:putative MATE family efflux protein
MLGLALPVLAEESLTLLVGYTDWWLAGHFLKGDEYKAAMGLMSYMMWLLPSLFAALAIGATAMVSRFVGADDRQKAEHVTNQAVLVGVAFTVVAGLALAAGGSSFVRAMQLERPADELALQYLWIVLPVLPLIMVEQVGIACLRGAGDTVSGFVAKSIVNVVNVVVSSLLVVGPGFIPRLGWEGIAIGTACGHGLGGLIVLGLLMRGRAGLSLRLTRMRPDGDLIRRLLRVGLPGGLDVAALLFCHLTYLAIINSMGVSAAAAHGLGVQIEALAWLPANAFHVAAATMTGQFLGAGDPRRAARSVFVAGSCAVGLLTIAALVFYFGGSLLTTFFTGDATDPTGIATARLLKIVCFATPALGLLMVLQGALRGAGDTRWSLGITLVSLILLRVPLACWFAWEQIPLPLTDAVMPGWGWGVAGAWWAMVIDVVVRCGLALLRFLHGGWKRTTV